MNVQNHKYMGTQYIDKIGHFFNFEIESNLSTSVFVFSTISQIWKKILHILLKKMLETGPNVLHELATFLKYHISLNTSFCW